jgi:putative OmpL-like beta-barrel porin-2
MRKLLVIAVAVALASLASASLRAEEGSELEISGNVTTVAGWQRPSKNPNLGADGILNDALAAPGGLTTDTFGFFIDQVELDLAKSFGENIRIRADLDFSPHRVNAGGGQVEIEQGYVTANIPAGNGIEFLMGRFNSGIGLDPIDRNELSTVSFSTVHRTLLPHNITGMRFGYDFSEATRLEVFVVNNLNGDVTAPGTAADSDIPSFGFNLSYMWGEEGNKSWLKFNGAGGPEGPTKKGWSFLGDLNGNFAVSDAFWIGAEGVYRQDDGGLIGAENAQFIAGQLKGRYAFSDVWDGTLRYSFVWDLDEGQAGGIPAGGLVPANPDGAVGIASGLGAAGTMHTISLATGYQITDGARFVVEGNVDISMPSAGGGTGFTPGVAGMFAYSF